MEVRGVVDVFGGTGRVQELHDILSSILIQNIWKGKVYLLYILTNWIAI